MGRDGQRSSLGIYNISLSWLRERVTGDDDEISSHKTGKEKIATSEESNFLTSFQETKTFFRGGVEDSNIKSEDSQAFANYVI